jgi:hypothetical protein
MKSFVSIPDRDSIGLEDKVTGIIAFMIKVSIPDRDSIGLEGQFLKPLPYVIFNVPLREPRQ